MKSALIALGLCSAWLAVGVDDAHAAQLCIKTSNGTHQLSAMPDGSIVTATACKAYETFDITGPLENGGAVGIKSAHGKFLTASWDGKLGFTPVQAAYETFTIERAAGPGPLGLGETFFLRDHFGKYLFAKDGGGGLVGSGSPNRQAWETFKLYLPLSAALTRWRFSGAPLSNGTYVALRKPGGGEFLSAGDWCRGWPGGFGFGETAELTKASVLVVADVTNVSQCGASGAAWHWTIDMSFVATGARLAHPYAERLVLERGSCSTTLQFAPHPDGQVTIALTTGWGCREPQWSSDGRCYACGSGDMNQAMRLEVYIVDPRYLTQP